MTITTRAPRFAMTMLATTLAVSIPAYANQTLTAMSVAQTEPQNTQLRLDFSDTPSLPTAYQLDNPPRLILDFNEVDNGLPSRLNSVNEGAVTDITTLSDDMTTRLIIGLDPRAQEPKVTTLIEDNALVVNIFDASMLSNMATTLHNPVPLVAQPILLNNSNTNLTYDSQATQTSQTRQPAANNQTMVVKVNPLLNPMLAQSNNQSARYDGVTNIVYNDNGHGGSVNINLANENVPIDIQRQGNDILIHITGANIPSSLVRRHDITDSLVSSIAARNQGKNGLIKMTMANDFEYQAYQSGNELVVSVKEPALLREPTLEEREYTGEPISVDFQNVEIRSVLHLLSQFTNMNIVANDSVSGSITLNLVNVPWDQALDIILKSKNLGMRANGNVILIAPAIELAKQEAEELEAQQQVDTFLPLRTEYIRLSYAIADDVLTLISQGRNSGSGNTNMSNDTGTLLSPRGTVTIDERTNTLIVKDISQSIENIRELVTEIDIPVRQVMIEARIVRASDRFRKEMGVKWGILSDGAATNRDLLVGARDTTLDGLRDFTVETTEINGKTVAYPSYGINMANNMNVDLGASSPAGQIAFGLLSMSDLMIDLELSAMQADGRGEVISTPKILTMDKQTARVASGTLIPYQEASASGATSTSFQEASLSLEATPNITPDGRIGLQIKIENGSPTIVGGDIGISEDSLMTNVLVEDGQTIVLGGIFKNTIDSGSRKVPFLGDLPYVGKLFRNDSQLNTKEELLIFITPKLVNQSVSQLN